MFTDIARWLFWSLFVVLAVWLQLLFPGMDFFAAGIMLCLQRGGGRSLVLLTLISVLIQEGSGPLVFGASLLRYGSLIGFFLLGRKFFDTYSPAFILLLGLVFAAVHYLSLKFMAGLQSWTILDQRILVESMLLFCVFLAQWYVLSRIYQMFFPHAPRY